MVCRTLARALFFDEKTPVESKTKDECRFVVVTYLAMTWIQSRMSSPNPVNHVITWRGSWRNSWHNSWRNSWREALHNELSWRNCHDDVKYALQSYQIRQITPYQPRPPPLPTPTRLKSSFRPVQICNTRHPMEPPSVLNTYLITANIGHRCCRIPANILFPCFFFYKFPFMVLIIQTRSYYPSWLFIVLILTNGVFQFPNTFFFLSYNPTNFFSKPFYFSSCSPWFVFSYPLTHKPTLSVSSLPHP